MVYPTTTTGMEEGQKNSDSDPRTNTRSISLKKNKSPQTQDDAKKRKPKLDTSAETRPTHWTPEEDRLLLQLIDAYPTTYPTKKQIPWLELAEEYNRIKGET